MRDFGRVGATARRRSRRSRRRARPPPHPPKLGYQVTGWLGIGVPNGTPAEIVERIDREVNAGLANPTVKGRMAELGSEIFTGSPPTSASS